MVWKALHKRREFLQGVSNLRDGLVESLGETRHELTHELNGERDALASKVSDVKAWLEEFTNNISGDLQDAADHATDDLKSAQNEAEHDLDDFFEAQGKLLEDFLFEIADHSYTPHGYDHSSHVHDYQRTFDVAANEIARQIDNFGLQELDAFILQTDNAIAQVENINADELAELAADTITLQDEISAYKDTAV